MPSTNKQILLIGLCMALCLSFTALVVSWSMAHGKLAIPPDYDDSHSMVEGALRWLTLRNHGLAAAWNEYLTRPPHSFLHYYFAAASFAVFGIHAGVVYWTSTLFLLAAMLGFASLLGTASLIRTVPLLVAFLCVPVAFNLIFDFRSECAMAALLFAACCTIIRAVWSPGRAYAWSAAAGGLLALSLGIKPAMFPYTLGMAMGASFLFAPSALLPGRRRWQIAWRRVLLIWALMILPVAFHYAYNWKPIFGYIFNIAFQSDYYKQGGNIGDQLLFHVLGFPGQLQLGSLAWPLLGVALGANLTALLRSGAADRTLRRNLFCCSFLACVAYAGVAVNAMNQNYFGMTFQFLLSASALLGIAYLAEQLPRIPGHGVCWLAAAAALAQWQIPITQNYVERTEAVDPKNALAWRREGPARVLDAIRPYWRADSPPTVWVAAYGWTDGNTIGWEAVQRDLPWKLWNYYDLPPVAGELVPAAAEILIVPEPGLMGTFDVPCNEALPAIRRWLDEAANTRLVALVADPNGKAIRIYRRVHRETLR